MTLDKIIPIQERHFTPSELNEIKIKATEEFIYLKFYEINLVYIYGQTTADKNSLEHATEG